MAALGMAVFVMTHRRPVLRRLSRVLPVVILAALVLAPNRYQSFAGPRTLLTLYERLTPFETVFGRADTVFLVSEYPMEIHEYVAHNYFTNPFVNLDYAALGQSPLDGAELLSRLEGRGVNLAYIDETLLNRIRPGAPGEGFPALAGSMGWRILGHRAGDSARWLLLQKPHPGRTN
jgi:hypothetical protein